jgi:thiamine pyrophosphate-dependent acetolactate synthase large subunit-like protein
LIEVIGEAAGTVTSNRRASKFVRPLSERSNPKPLREVRAGRCRQIERKPRQPVFLIGDGVIIPKASDVLREIVAITNIPVVSSLMGIGALRSDDPIYFGMLGMHGTFTANKAVPAPTCSLP